MPLTPFLAKLNISQLLPFSHEFFSKNFRLLETEQHKVRRTLEFLFTLSIFFVVKNNTLNIGTRKLALKRSLLLLTLIVHTVYGSTHPPFGGSTHPSPLWPGHNSMKVMCACECRSLLSVSSAISLWATKQPEILSWSRTVWFCCLCAKKFDQFLFPQITSVKYSTAPPCPETKWSLTQQTM